jgi:hypothetical protein
MPALSESGLAGPALRPSSDTVRLEHFHALLCVGSKIPPMARTMVAVGSTIAGRPRTDPYVQSYRIRLLPKVVTQRNGMQNPA